MKCSKHMIIRRWGRRIAGEIAGGQDCDAAVEDKTSKRKKNKRNSQQQQQGTEDGRRRKAGQKQTEELREMRLCAAVERGHVLGPYPR